MKAVYMYIHLPTCRFISGLSFCVSGVSFSSNFQETIELEGSVRSLTRRLITVVNPLRPDELITFTERTPKIGGGTPPVNSHGGGWWRCSSPHVRLVRVGEMAGNLEGVFAVDYRPLVVTEDGKPEEADLSFDIEELGTYR